MKQNLLYKLNIQDKSEQELLDILEQKLNGVQIKLDNIQNMHKQRGFDEKYL